LEEWQALAAIIGQPDWATDPAFSTPRQRAERHDEIDEAIRAWTCLRDHNVGARELQAAGIPAAPVMANWELLSDVHLAERNFYVPIVHPEVGVMPFPGMPWKLSRTP